ncbi:hypothetical protein BH11PSE8_BH11PSE8_06440 [soil metagenome]
MAKNKSDFGDLLTIGNLDELRSAVGTWRTPISLPQARQLATHAKSLTVNPTPLRIAVVHTYTSDLLDPWFDMAGALQGLDVQCYHAPYGLALQEAAPDSALVAHRPDATLLMLRREDLHPELARPLAGLERTDRARLRIEASRQLRSIIDLFRAQKTGHLILTLLPSISAPGLGHFDAQSDASEAGWWSELKADVGQWMREQIGAALFLDLDDVLQQVGRTAFFDLRYWYSAQFPFGLEAAREISRRVIDVGVLLKTPRAKVLVLDADNTLWGGVVGEDGFDGIAIGPEYPGSAYRDFQRRILDFQQRGFILALCSKNNPADVDQVLQKHPHQLLRDEHFAAKRVNWLPKADNLISLAKELNIGLDSFIFVDDSDHECAAVRHALPLVEVVQTPKRAVDVPRCLDQVARLEVLSITSEDSAKTELYAQERRRREFTETVGASLGTDDYLARLDMKMQVSLNAGNHLTRLSQLTQKTNQFNLTTRRYDEQQIKSFVDASEWWVVDFSLSDIFGDSGIVGAALVHIMEPGKARLDTFLMSCRVIGRHAEVVFLNTILRQLKGAGFSDITAEFIETAKNGLAKSFLVEQKFEPICGNQFQRNLDRNPPHDDREFPISVAVLAMR